MQVPFILRPPALLDTLVLSAMGQKDDEVRSHTDPRTPLNLTNRLAAVHYPIGISVPRRPRRVGAHTPSSLVVDTNGKRRLSYGNSTNSDAYKGK